MSERYYKYYLGLLAAAPPLSTDMYLPAMPKLAELWSVSDSQVHLSLVLWFATYGAMLLVWGSISDRYGRRPILIYGLSTFVATSLLCGLAGSVEQLIVARILQGAAAAGGSAMAMAIARDRFSGRDLQQILAWIGVILGLAPMIAPSIGAAILHYADWRWIFVVQGAMAALTLGATLMFYQESAILGERSGVSQLVLRYVRLMKNRNYLATNGSTGILSAPLLGFVAFSPIAYMQNFGLSESQFALVFGANALCVVAGSAFCARMVGRIPEQRLLILALFGCLLGGILQLVWMSWWGWGPWPFGICLAIYSFAFGLSRPLVNHLVLSQVEHEFGAAASAIVCYQFLCGAVGMAVATASWGQPFYVFAVLSTVCPVATVLVLGLWLWNQRQTQVGLPDVDLKDRLQPKPSS